MKFQFAIFTLFFALTSVAAETSKNFRISTNLDFSSGEKKVRAENDVVLSEGNKTWATLVKPNDGVTLLGRIRKFDADTIQMEYLVVDLNTQNVMITTPVIASLLGEESIVTTKGEGASVRIGVLATRDDKVAVIKQ